MQIMLVFNVFVTSQLKGCRCEIWAGRGSKNSVSAGQQLWDVHSSPRLPPFLLRHVSRDDRNRGLAPERLHCEYTPYPGYFVLCIVIKCIMLCECVCCFTYAKYLFRRLRSLQWQ